MLPDEWKPLLVERGLRAFRADQILQSLYRDWITDWDEATTLPKDFRETLSIVAAEGGAAAEPAFELRVNGEKPMEPRRIAQIQKHEKWHEKAYPYAGYRPSGRLDYVMPGKTIAQAGDEVKLGPDEFYACGDNSPSSYDSRYWGPVPARNLRGLAGGVFWPFATHRWGPIE